MNDDRASLSRCIAVWLLVSLISYASLAWAGAPAALGERPSGSFDVVLLWLAAVALGACAVWLWLVATLVLVGAARGADWSIAGCPPVLRRGLLVACGVVLTGTPVYADSGVAHSPDPRLSLTSLISGLPLPDRATGARTLAPVASSPAVRSPTNQAHSVVVRPGDTLWGLAAAALPPLASDAEITVAWQAVYAANRDVLDDPDLIHPGTRLVMPDLDRPHHR